MKLHFLKLRFETASNAGSGAWIVPVDHSQDKEGWPLLTPRCVSTNQLEFYIDRMLTELEAIRTEARKRFD